MEIPNKYWDEWEKLVEESKQNLVGTCPLFEDEVIVEIDKHIKLMHKIFLGVNS